MEATAQLIQDLEPIPLTRLDHADPELFAELMTVVERVASKGAFTGGAEVDDFETELATYCGTREAIGVSSGTEALVLALLALEIGPGDEVIVPTNSFIATAEAVTRVGATPCLVDIDETSHTITAELVERSLSSRTRCVIPVHLYGRTVDDIDAILDLARAYDLRVIEDACQAHGAFHRGRRAGSMGDVGCFSFYPAKNLGAWGDGGAVTTDDDKLAEQIRLLRSHGERPRYHHRLPGTTARLDALQAAILRVKLRRLDGWNDRRRAIAAQLSSLLEDGPVELPRPLCEGGDHVFHQYVVSSRRRDALRDHLADLQVATGIHYPVPIHLSEAYSGIGLRNGDFPVAERAAGLCCSLPIGPFQTDSETARVAEAVASFAGEEGRSWKRFR